MVKLKNAEIFKNAVIYEGDVSKYEKINKYYDVKTIMKKKLYEQIKKSKRTDDIDDSDGWTYKSVANFLTENSETLFPKTDGILYQVDFLLSQGWRSSSLGETGDEIDYYDNHTTESSANVEDQLIYGISLKKLHYKV